MFVHAGASLHGHEYSARSPSGTQSSPPAVPGPKRNSLLLRTALGSTIHRSSTPPAPSASPLSPSSLPSKTKPRPFSDSFVSSPPAEVGPSAVKHVQQSPAMTEQDADPSDSDACASDSDLSRAAVSSRRARKQSLRSSTNYVLAQPAPKLRNKQRLIHTKPQLITQLQLLAPGDRPRPVIDAYPSSAFSKTIMAPLLRRVPRIAGIKTELSVRDIMLVKSQDYAVVANDTDSDDGDDNMKARDLVAILSPLQRDDCAEIVMADGAVWTASPRNTASSSGSYDFVCVDENGATLTARWARRRCGSKHASPITTPSISAMPPSPPLQEYKYTFSFINPECRRHPIMATMTSTSLEIFATYTPVSSSNSRHTPASPALASPSSSVSSGREGKGTKQVVHVQDWQKNFIAISAVWVASRSAILADPKQTDSGLTSSAPSSPIVPAPPVRIPSRTSTPKLGVKKSHTAALDGSDRSVTSATDAQPASRASISILPKRATSTGAAFMQRRRAILRADSGSSEDADSAAVDKRGRRTLSGNWTGNMASGLGPTSLMGVAVAEVGDDQEAPSTARPAPSRVATPANVGPQQIAMTTTSQAQSLRNGSRGDTAAIKDANTKTRHIKWKAMTAWFNKIRTR